MKNKKRESSFVAKWESQVKKGTLEYIILLCLSRRSFYGYELIVEIKSLLSFDIAEGTIYPLLNRLKKEECISSEWVEMEAGIPRKYYKLTSEGELRLGEMEEYWINLSSAIQKLMKRK